MECLAQGDASAIDIYPLFFNCGRHVAKDIPTLVSQLQHQYPGVKLSLLPYFGSFEGLAATMANHIAESTSRAT